MVGNKALNFPNKRIKYSLPSRMWARTTPATVTSHEGLLLIHQQKNTARKANAQKKKKSAKVYNFRLLTARTRGEGEAHEFHKHTHKVCLLESC